jgi:hypothetical protein
VVEKYTMRSTSTQSAILEDKVLKETANTRLLLRPEIVTNAKDPDAGVRVSLIHQRKGTKEQWEDFPSPPLSSIKAGEIAKLELNSEKTLRLFDELKNLFAISESGGVRFGENVLVVGREDEILRVDVNRASVIKWLLDKNYPEEIWRELIRTDPDLATRLSYARIQTERAKAIQQFSTNLEKQKDEQWWQSFFDTNLWIFGYGLDYRILRSVRSQPNYGGAGMSGQGGQRGDHLLKTQAVKRFTVLVEIKRPDAPLLGKREYRNGAWQLGDDLTGGVSQLQINSRQWETDGSRIEQNADTLRQQGVSTIRPKGILVVGHTAQLDSIAKLNTFESFRRNITSPEILTFDELHERAKFIVQQESEDGRSNLESRQSF